MTNDLAALSAAATKGLCFAQAPDTEHDFGIPIVATDDLAAPMPTNGMVLWATMQPTEIDALDTVRAEANAAFAVALWNAYRSGDLVLIDREGMRVKMAAAMAVSQGADEGDAEIWFPEADAAIAAILGVQP